MTGTSTPAPNSFLGRSPWALAANGMTSVRVILAPVLVLMVLRQNPWWLTFWIGLIAALTDYFDGKLARRSAPTTFGIFVDPLADKAVVLLGAAALVWIDRFFWLPVALIAFREVAMTFYRSWLARQDVSVPARTSAKYKALLQALALLAAVCPALDGALWVADVFLWLAVVVTYSTAYQYARDGNSLRV